MRPALLLSFSLAICFPLAALGGLRLPAIIGDHMVVQQDMPVRLWGWAGAKDTVIVRALGQTVETEAAADGAWELELEPLDAGGPYSLTIESAGEVIVIGDVLSGEVWLASGQSNMEWKVSGSDGREEALAAATIPEIRLFDVERAASGNPQSDLIGRWRRLSPASLDPFSAVAWNFGREIYSEIQQPVGLISSAWGGTRVEAWIPRGTLESIQDGQNYVRHLSSVEDPSSAGPAYLYNGMIHPLRRYPIRGALWYQGESNARQPEAYGRLFPEMIKAWRDVWGQGDFPFYYVELASYHQRSEEPAPDQLWAFTREAQQKALELARTGVASAIDVGNADNIHPTDKITVGQRLARLALENVYEKDLEGAPQSPRVVGSEVQGNAIVLKLENVGPGLVLKKEEEGAPSGFAIAGEDGQWQWAEVEILDNGKLRISSSSVSAPLYVRYGWADNPYISIFTKDGLPLLPFRTDSLDREVPAQSSD